MPATPPPPRRRPPQVFVAPPPGPPTGRSPERSEPRRRSDAGRTKVLLALGALVSVVAVAAVVLVLTGGSDDSTHVSRPASAAVKLELGTTTVHSAGPDTQLPEDQRAQILATVSAYVDAASVQTLRTGATADQAALTKLFEPAALARLTGADRAALLDEGFPKVSGSIVATGPPIDLVALASADSRILLVSAVLDLDVVGRDAAGPVTIKRTGQLVLEPLEGGWRISGWQISVDRNGPGLPVTPTSAPAPGAPTTTTTKPATTTTRKS